MNEERWKQLTEWPLTAAAVAFLGVYTWIVLAQPTGPAAHLGEVLLWAMWLAFAVDYAVRWYLAKSRWRWFFRHLHEFAIVVLPMLRPLRLLRLLTMLNVLQRSVGVALRGRVIVYTAGATVLLLFVASLAMLETERDAADATITTFPDALWWSATTVTTVGYGDYSPVTGTGRVIAAMLMVGGIALLGVVTATLASWIVQRVAEEDEASQSATRAQVAELTAQIAALRGELRERTAVAEVEPGAYSLPPYTSG
ncbi:two pore domain potassium channel family protein [Nocardia higoensis]|uniref:Two pore domain potassium channel family protein n=1 Tax=Nocardia higoensis TaxID=228599 RepID=A0ABS0D5A1_9NOCA|nr:potassium channel family protein [Nocardia higoensis]MBF6353662.1 two pore domain potassium channel family protein [Nocardia higoensis]